MGPAFCTVKDSRGTIEQPYRGCVVYDGILGQSKHYARLSKNPTFTKHIHNNLLLQMTEQLSVFVPKIGINESNYCTCPFKAACSRQKLNSWIAIKLRKICNRGHKL